MLSKPTFLLLLPVMILLGCKKKGDPTTPTSTSPTSTSPTSKMGGVRNWHRSHYYSATGIHFPTPVLESYFLADTTFAVTVVDDNTVQFLGNVYTIDTANSSDSVVFFGSAYYYYRYRSGKGVVYYPLADSIVQCKGDIHGTSDYWELRDLCYSY